jgi:hypothetical protein
MEEKVTATERALGELRADLTGAPADAMNRMRAAVLTHTVHNPSPVHPAAARPGSARPHRFRPTGPGRRMLRPATIAIAAAAAAAIGIGTVAVATGGRSAPAGTANQAAGSGRPTPLRGGADPAVVQLLGRVSLAADSSPLAPRDNQFIYTRWQSKIRPVGRPGVPDKLPTDITGEYWDSVDGSQPNWNVSVERLGHMEGTQAPENPHPGLDAPTYKFLTTLPTDPDRLLALIRQSRTVRAGQTGDLDQSVFETIGTLIHRALLPPGLAAALYRAAAKIPGVRIVPDTVDAAGRHGIGVFRSSARTAPRGQAYAMMWIFNPKTYEFRGERLDIGATSNSVALLQVAVVDKAARRPNGRDVPAVSPHKLRGTPPRR